MTDHSKWQTKLGCGRNTLFEGELGVSRLDRGINEKIRSSAQQGKRWYIRDAFEMIHTRMKKEKPYEDWNKLERMWKKDTWKTVSVIGEEDVSVCLGV